MNTITKHRLKWPLLILAAVLAALVLFAVAGWAAAEADADATTNGELAYISTIESYGIDYSTEDAAIKVGYGVCDAFRQGASLNAVVRAGVRGSGGYYDQTDVAQIAGAASGALCPGVKVKGIDY